MIVRHATLDDRRDFKHLWRMLLEEGAEQGSEIAADEHNLDIYVGIFERYIQGLVRGVVILAEIDDAGPVGVVMWGDPQNPFHMNFPRLASGWGTYVVPEAREDGISLELRKEACKALKALGFTHMMGMALESNLAGIESMKKVPGVKLHGLVSVTTLSEVAA